VSVASLANVGSLRRQSVRDMGRHDMTQRLSETYRGFDLLIEALPADDAQHIRVQRTITRKLGERMLTVDTRCETTEYSTATSHELLTNALRDAREAVDRLLGGWHPAYAHAQSLHKRSAH
jgi:hypothetical protein